MKVVVLMKEGKNLEFEGATEYGVDENVIRVYKENRFEVGIIDRSATLGALREINEDKKPERARDNKRDSGNLI